jgi:hypothetical protein
MCRFFVTPSTQSVVRGIGAKTNYIPIIMHGWAACTIQLKENGLLDDILAENSKIDRTWKGKRPFLSMVDVATLLLTCTLYIGLHIYCCRAATMNPSYHFFTSTMWPYAQHHAWIALRESGVGYEMVTFDRKTNRKTFLSLMCTGRQTWFLDSWCSCQGGAFIMQQQPHDDNCRDMLSYLVSWQKASSYANHLIIYWKSITHTISSMNEYSVHIDKSYGIFIGNR